MGFCIAKRTCKCVVYNAILGFIFSSATEILGNHFSHDHNFTKSNELLLCWFHFDFPTWKTLVTLCDRYIKIYIYSSFCRQRTIATDRNAKYIHILFTFTKINCSFHEVKFKFNRHLYNMQSKYPFCFCMWKMYTFCFDPP